jgi:hypothetical protein
MVRLIVLILAACCVGNASRAQVLDVTLNGPSSPMHLNGDDAGPTGQGALLCDVSLAADAGGAWDLTSLVFTASGTGSHDTAYSAIAVFEDDGSGTWDGSPPDALAAQAAAGFVSGTVTFNLAATTLPDTTQRRFFLVGLLNGTATSGQTFNAALTGVVATPPPGGIITGLPTPASTALVIDSAFLRLTNGFNQPAAPWHLAGEPGTYGIGQFRAFALNDAVTLSGFTLTCLGSGDWSQGVDQVAGVQVYRDNGDAAFSPATDMLVFEGGGITTVDATFTTPVAMPVSTSADLWILLTVTPNAGSTAIASAETFTMSVLAPGDVQASAPVAVGPPTPQCAVLSAVNFNLTSFSPLEAEQAGGDQIVINGSGFLLPFSVEIGGVACPGTAIVQNGTMVTGLQVPPGKGKKLTIRIKSAGLDVKAPLRFSYEGEDDEEDEEGCALVPGRSPWIPAIPLAIGMAIWVSRRRRLLADTVE